MLRKIIITLLISILSFASFGDTITVVKGNDEYKIDGSIKNGELYISFGDVKKIMENDYLDRYITVVDENNSKVTFLRAPRSDDEVKLKIGDTYGFDGLQLEGIRIQGDEIYQYLDKDILKFTSPGEIEIYNGENMIVKITVVSDIVGKKISGTIDEKMLLSEGDYVIDKDMLINTSGRLVLKDGVRISVKNGARIKVLGKIIKEGDGRAEIYYDPLVPSGSIILETSNVELKNIDFTGINRTYSPFIHSKGRNAKISNCSFSGENLGSEMIKFEKYGNRIYKSTFENIIIDGHNLLTFKSNDGDSFVRESKFKNIVDKSTYSSTSLLEARSNSVIMDCEFDGIKNMTAVESFNKVEGSVFKNFSSLKSIDVIYGVDTVYKNTIENLLFTGSVGDKCIAINEGRNIEKNIISNVRSEYINDNGMIMGISASRNDGRIIDNELDDCFIGIRTNVKTTKGNKVNNSTYPFMSFTGSGYITISKNEFDSGEIYDIEKDIDLKRIKISR